MKALDLTDQRFGSLVAQHTVTIGKKRGWMCRCDCGEEVAYPTFQLTAGNAKTCKGKAHAKHPYKAGDVRGQLTIHELFKKQDKGRYFAKCTCSCGNPKVTSVKELQRQDNPSCGCQRNYSGAGKPEGEAILNSLITNYKSNAAKKGLEFTLTKPEMVKLFKGHCFFCGVEPSKVHAKAKIKGSYTYSSIDRIDSTKGYTPENTTSCCTPCNYLKGNKTNEEFLVHIERIFLHSVAGV